MFKFTTSTTALAIAMLSGPAFAQATGAAAAATPAATLANPAAQAADTTVAGAAAQADTTPSDIIVTGTRTTGLRAVDSPAPIQVLGSDALKRVGQTDLMQVLAQQLPSVQAQSFGNDQTAFHPSIKLRGLNPNHTLILVDGKRRHGTANVVVTNALWTGGAAPDIGLIPTDAIDHVEVLQDGAAAQYGTDAIAGVVNFILKKNDHGGTLDATAGEYFDGGGRTYDIQGNLGIAPIADMYLSITGEYKFHDYSFRGDVDPRVVDTGQSTSANTGNSGGRTILARYPGVSSFDNYPYVNRIFGDGQMKLVNIMYNTGYTGIPGIELYSFGSYSHRTGRTFQNYRLPNVIYGKSASPNIAVPTGDIPFKSGFSPQEVLRETDFAFTDGIKGEVANTTVDLSVTYGRDFDGIFVENSSNAALYYDTSTAAVTNAAGVVTTAAQPGYSPRNVHDGDFVASQFTVNLDLTHKFDVGFAEPINVAGGLEFRRDKYELLAGEVASYYVSTNTAAPGGGIQSFFGYAPSNASSNTRKNYSEYLDISTKPIESILLDGAVRHEHYTDFGDTTVFKLTGRWDITPGFAIRGTGSTGFRAPTLAEEFYSGINVSVSSLSGIFAPNSAGAGALGLGGLGPEKSSNFSAGVVLQPMDKLTITLDAYSIYLRNRIVQSSGFTGYSNNCKFLPAGYTAGVNVTAAYNAFVANSANTCTGFISPQVLTALYNNGVPIISVINTINNGASGSLSINSFVNGLNTLTHGVEFLATYNSDFFGLAQVNWSLGANYNDTKVKKVLAPPANVNQAQGLFDIYSQSAITETTPKWRATGGAYFNAGMFSVNLRESLYGPARLLGTTPANASINYYQRIGVTFIADLEVSVTPVTGVKLSFGANNLFNKYPNKLPADIRAQQYALSSTAYVSQYPSFSAVGINGGYYYGRASLKF